MTLVRTAKFPGPKEHQTVFSQESHGKGDWRCRWINELAILMEGAEKAEQSLSYLSPCGSEAERKKTGSYYTPADVSVFFWKEFLALNKVTDGDKIKSLWQNHHFIEPSAGAGALIFALLQEGVRLGLPLRDLSKTEMTIIDINQEALDFIKEKLDALASRWEINFSGVHYICSDFRTCTIPVSPRHPLFFGNPPFVSNPRGSEWKNLFADFLSRAVRQMGPNGKCHFILPVSIAFSRDYALLRQTLRNSEKSVALSSFDNIPDTLFPSGKPEHTNTNKANSQRCSIVTIFREENPRILSTRMHRWSKSERQELLARSPDYHNVTSYSLDDQFPRPENTSIMDYLSSSKGAPSLATLLSDNGPHSLFVSSVARNFIGFREEAASSVHHLRFATKKNMRLVLLLLSSDLFLDYWRTVGDGFHVTRGNIIGFPMHSSLVDTLKTKTHKGKLMWDNRSQFAKTKRHPRGVTVSYDFTDVSFPVFDTYLAATSRS